MKKRRLLLAAAVCLTGILAPLFALEFSIRFLHPLLPRDLKVVWIRHALMSKTHLAHPALIWALDASANLRYPSPRRPWRMSYIPYAQDPRYGYRADRPAKPPVDLLVLGDSFTYGFEVDQNDTWVERLKRSTGIEAVNTAVTSYGTSQEAELFSLYGASFKPRSVVQIVVPNDGLDNYFFHYVNRSKELRISNLCWFLGLNQDGRACKLVRPAMRSIVLELMIFQLQALRKNAHIDTPEMATGTRLICDDLERVSAQSKKLGARYAVVLLGQWRAKNLEPFRKTVEACTQRLALPTLLLNDHGEQRRTGKRLFGRFDWHWNEEGHAYVARELERFLTQEKLISARVKPSR